MKNRMIVAALALACSITGTAQQLAFPGAEGFGAYATGGRGGTVVHVTNLNASGAGSLADAVSKPNRIVVFDVGGVIDISGGETITISDNITIAGQTAPGGGITVYGNRVIANGKNIIIRYLRMRGSIKMNSGKCTFTCDGASNVILDHCSISWGRWDNVHISNSQDITWQNCIISEGIDPQNFGAITDGTRNWTITHCLWANNKSRNPKLKCYAQQINNVIYNCGMGSIGGHSAADNYQDLIGNYYIAGPNSSVNKYFDQWTETDHLYSQGNYTDPNCDGTLNGTLITDYNGATPMSQPHLYPAAPVVVESAQDAYKSIVSHCGASRVRDSHDLRLIGQLKSLGKQGAIIYNESEVGGIGTVPGGEAPLDSDGDGIPDEWETANGLNPYSAADAMKDSNGNGYANIEDYINSLAMASSYLMYPTDLVASSTGTTAKLTWGNLEDAATATLVEQSTDGKEYTQIAELKASVRTYTVKNLDKNQVYYFRLRNTDGERYSNYSNVVQVNQPAGTLPGGGTAKGTATFTPKEGKLYRILNYATVAYNSSTNLSGNPRYMMPATANGYSILTSTTEFAWDNPALLWEFVPTGEDGVYHVRNQKTKQYLASYMIDTSNGNTTTDGHITLTDNPTSGLTINYTGDDRASQSGIADNLSFYRINAPGNKNYQIRAKGLPNPWIWGSGTITRADMIFTFVEIDLSLVRLYTADLQNAIAKANVDANSVTIGNGTLCYPQDAYEQFIATIERAQSFYNSIDENTTQEQVDEMQQMLQNASAAFMASQNRTWGECDITRVYAIFSFGTHSGASTTTASAGTARRYLYTTNDGTADALMFRESITENDVLAGKADAVKKMTAAQWHLVPSETHPGYYTAVNMASGTYLQIAPTLSAEPVEFYPAYQKEDLGHHAFSMQVSKENTRCINMGVLDANTTIGAVTFANAPADRTRLRWMFEDAGEYDPGIVGINAISARPQPDNTVFDLGGRRIGAETSTLPKGIYIVGSKKIVVK